jgi:hypothetical protein
MTRFPLITTKANMSDRLGNKTNLRNFTPPDPGAIEYDQALKTVGGMPAISPGMNELSEYTTGAQPKDALGGEAKFD